MIMTNILENIVVQKKREILLLKESLKDRIFESSVNFNRNCNSLLAGFQNSTASGVIAEYKRMSPSKSAINLEAKVENVAPGYALGGASAISVLTDQLFFGGHIDHLRQTRQLLPTMPLLRKEFILDEIQILEAKDAGADLILLIAEILTKSEIRRLSQFAKSLGLEVLLELHTAEQLEKLDDGVDFIGVNNRDLKSFEVDYERSIKLCELLPQEIPKIAESGLSETDTLVYLYKNGFRAFLIGEQFMKSSDPGKACQNFIQEYMDKRKMSIS